MKLNELIAILVIIFTSPYSKIVAQPKAASIFLDNMVLQQQSTVPVWGWSNAGSLVKITTSWNKSR